MIYINMFIEGTSPVLMHRATEEALTGETRRNTVEERENPRITAGKAVYRMPGSEQLALPGSAFARLVREAGSSHKARGSRKSLKYVIPAAVLVLDDLCPLFLMDRKSPANDFEVDARPVTIPATKGRVMRYRARLNQWSCGVNLRINEEIIAESIVRQLYTEGLQQIGVGDFRPEKGGPFGTSSIVAWDVQTESTRRQVRRNGTPEQARA